jgi:hypothetical protein
MDVLYTPLLTVRLPNDVLVKKAVFTDELVAYEVRPEPIEVLIALTKVVRVPMEVLYTPPLTVKLPRLELVKKAVFTEALVEYEPRPAPIEVLTAFTNAVTEPKEASVMLCLEVRLTKDASVQAHLVDNVLMELLMFPTEALIIVVRVPIEVLDALTNVVTEPKEVSVTLCLVVRVPIDVL